MGPRTNVMVLVGPTPSVAEAVVADEIMALLEARNDTEALRVKLPRAEAMLLPRLVGLWGSLVFVGSTNSRAPGDSRLLQYQSELLEVMPQLVFVGSRSLVWPGWDRFAGCQPQAVEVAADSDAAASRVVAAVLDRLIQTQT